MYLLLNFALSAIGVSPPAVNMFLIPIFITLCYAAKTNELFLSIGSNAGGMSGTLCSIGMVGIMLGGMISSVDEGIDTSVIIMHVFRTATIVFFIIFAVYYVVLKLWKMKLPEELIRKPEAPTAEQKKNLIIILVCILFLFGTGSDKYLCAESGSGTDFKSGYIARICGRYDRTDHF